MKKSEQMVVGAWRITEMEVWDADFFEMEAAAHITLRDDLTSALQFGWAHGAVVTYVSVVDGVARAKFSWSGADESDPVSRRGWLDATGDQALGCILFHLGDNSAFSAVRAA